MPKTDASFDPAQYAPVADRISLFFEAFPTGRIVTRLVRRSRSEVIFRACVFRAAEDAKPAATGWAAEREGDGDVNTVACLENTETSAIGRALANLGFTASLHRPSREEMLKASRARLRAVAEPPSRPYTGAPRTRATSAHNVPLQQRANVAMDLLRLIALAERVGLRAARAEAWRTRIRAGRLTAANMERCERRLRAWVGRAQERVSR